MLDTNTIRQDHMPQEMRFLLDAYPRNAREAHPGFKEKTRHWLGAHQMIRRVAELVRLDTEGFLSNDMVTNAYAARLSRYGGTLVSNLHGHHGWEDHVYFPELSDVDPRFDAGLELLEKDHADLDRVLDDFTHSGNRVIKRAQLDEAQARDEAGDVHKTAQTIEAFLKRPPER
jgi:hemerythrin-like domain-containing protein